VEQLRVFEEGEKKTQEGRKKGVDGEEVKEGWMKEECVA